MFKLAKLISGGQTGADRGVLDAAIQMGILHGGFCPKGRRAEDGIIPEMYDLIETKTDRYEERTELNILHSDATIVFISGKLSPGSNLTKWLAHQYGKPCLVVNLAKYPSEDAATLIEEWLLSVRPLVLNGAGSRESRVPGIQRRTTNAMLLALAKLDS